MACFVPKLFVLYVYISSYVFADEEAVFGNGCKYGKKIDIIIQEQSQINERLDQQNDMLDQLVEKVESLTGVTAAPTYTPTGSPDRSFGSCAEAYESGFADSGVYTIHVANKNIEMFCDMSQGGGWTVFQRRQDGSVDFFRNWNDYKNGFGDVNGEYWLGNDLLAAMTAEGTGDYVLRIDGTTFALDSQNYDFNNFRVAGEGEKYRLSIDPPDDDGHGMSPNNGQYFSTRDRDNDNFSRNCAEDEYKGGWWYSDDCGWTNLNAPYRSERIRSTGGDIFFYPLDEFYTIKFSQMKFRPMNFGDK